MIKRNKSINRNTSTRSNTYYFDDTINFVGKLQESKRTQDLSHNNSERFHKTTC